MLDDNQCSFRYLFLNRDHTSDPITIGQETKLFSLLNFTNSFRILGWMQSALEFHLKYSSQVSLTVHLPPHEPGLFSSVVVSYQVDYWGKRYVWRGREVWGQISLGSSQLSVWVGHTSSNMEANCTTSLHKGLDHLWTGVSGVVVVVLGPVPWEYWGTPALGGNQHTSLLQEFPEPLMCFSRPGTTGEGRWVNLGAAVYFPDIWLQNYLMEPPIEQMFLKMFLGNH